ncbi:thiamine diphosphokinase [Eubacterium sp.]|uniref:thiamine diphosphokinase n=1 Tax=Eubacterium sp. TaxID=142586 RepID=UPI002FC6905A
MKAIIFTGGRYRNLDFYTRLLKKERPAYILCADKGTETALALGIRPDVVLGDFDSIAPGVLEQIKKMAIPMVVHPTHKDETDTELAITTCLERGCTEILLLGALGTRMDHSLSNIHLLGRLQAAGVYGRIMDEYNTLFLVEDRRALKLPVGTTLSVIAYTDRAEGVTLRGFEYPLDRADLDHLAAGLGVSNVVVAKQQEIIVESGTLLVDVVHEAGFNGF